MYRFATNVKALRKLRGWTQTELADRVGVSSVSIFLIESGKNNNPGLKTAISMSSAFEVTLDDLLHGSLDVKFKSVG